jgi:hypothetical protein
MQTGDPDEAGPHPTHPGFEAGSKAEVRHRRLMAASAEGRADVFEPKRLDTEERSETEPLIPGVGPQEEHPHATLPRATRHPSAARLLCKARKEVGDISRRISNSLDTKRDGQIGGRNVKRDPLLGRSRTVA